MKQPIYWIAGFALALFAAKASQAATPHALSSLLSRQSRLVEAVAPYVERMDLPAILVLKRSTTETLDSLRNNGAAHMQTMQGLQELVIQYRFSRSLFEKIRAEHTSEWLLDLQKTAQKVAESTGFDESPYTRITRSVFAKIKDLLQEIVQLPIPEELRVELVSLKPTLGRLLAKAAEGDHAETFRAAAEAQERITALYPQFNQISIGNEAFNHVLEIQGLNEFYAQFSSQPVDGGAEELAKEGFQP